MHTGDVIVAMQMWDIGGQSSGSKMIRKYMCGAHVRVTFLFTEEKCVDKGILPNVELD